MIGAGGFMAAPKVTERPAYNTAPIRCGKLKCKWRGYEGELVSVPSKKFGAGVTDKVCPVCGKNEYCFMTPREIAVWERRKDEGVAA